MMKTHHLVEIDDSSLNPHLDVIENRFEYISVLLIMNDKKQNYIEEMLNGDDLLLFAESYKQLGFSIETHVNMILV